MREKRVVLAVAAVLVAGYVALLLSVEPPAQPSVEPAARVDAMTAVEVESTMALTDIESTAGAAAGSEER